MDGSSVRRFEETPVAKIYFSDANIEALQAGIRWRVFVESNGVHVISRQSDTELAVIMRSVYLQESKNDPNRDVLEQVRALNASILAFCVPRIIEEINMYHRFQKDVDTTPEPLARGELATSKGTKTLTMFSSANSFR